MKKIFFLIALFFCSVELVNAANLLSEELPYYVKISKNGEESKIIKVKKVYDKDTLNVVFNVNFNNYETHNSFNIYEDYSYKKWQIPKNSIPFFNTIVYYGYLKDSSDLNYFITQMIVWSHIFNYSVEICDKDGNSIDTYKEEYNKLYTDITNHITQSTFFNKTYNVKLGTKNTFTYYDGAPILNNPDVDGLTFANEGNDIHIYNDKVGKYYLMFTKEYEQESYSYNDGSNFYIQSLKGPRNLSYYIFYNVIGTKLNIEENLIGIDNRYGDAYLESKYELYVNDDLEITIDNFNDLYIENNNNYMLKDISNNKGVNNVEDISFEVGDDEEYTIIIDKHVVSKNISLSIDNDKNYYVYLKSNNELYEVIYKNKDLITLPYGIYYIVDEVKSYYKEIIVENNIDEELVIEDTIKEEYYEEGNNNEKTEVEEGNKMELEQEEMDEEEKFEELIKIPEEDKVIVEVNKETFDDSKKEDILEDNVIFEDLEIENPETMDHIDYYKVLFIFSCCFLIVIFGILKLIN